MKTTTVFFTFVMLVGCTGRVPKENKSDTQVITEGLVDQNSYNAMNSLDLAGTYQGVLPCADCNGIATEILINNDQTFVIKSNTYGKMKTKYMKEKVHIHGMKPKIPSS